MKKIETSRRESRTPVIEEKNKLIIFPRIIFSIFILIVVFILPLILISGSRSFYLHQLEKNDCYSMISKKDCIDLSMNALNYLKSGTPLDARYSSQERSHFTDVKGILDVAKALVFVLVVFIVVYLILLFFLNKQEIFKTLRLSGWIIISFMALLLTLITISFNGSFFFFHALLFPQGNWTFPFDSTIIVVFSEGFFVRAAFVSFILSLGVGVSILGISFLRKKK
jgi:uncharacterized membrane protein